MLGVCDAYLTLPSYARVSQELPPGVGGGERERLDTVPAKLSCYYSANSQRYCRHTAINKES